MDVREELTRLVALSPGDGRITGLVRAVCGRTLGLPPVPAAVAVTRPASEAESVIAEFAEQFSIDVSMIGDEQRAQFLAVLGDKAFDTVVQIYLADYLPRMRAGLEALRVGQDHLGWVHGVGSWDHSSDAADAVFNGFLPAVARLRELDALTSELVRLRGAAQHNCRLCKSLRETTALGVGGSETLYDDVARFEDSMLVTDRQKAALRYVDALIWSPARIDPSVAAAVRAHLSAAQAVELTFDVMRNASNKIAVALAADAARVQDGTERYLLGADGQTVFG